MQELIREVNQIAQKELDRANEKFPLFHSPHEGIAIIFEEVNESQDEIKRLKYQIEYLWERIKGNEGTDILNREAKELKEIAVLLACESTQVAAMCQKFIDSFNLSPTDTENKSFEGDRQASNEK